MLRIVQVAKHYPPVPGGIERTTQFYSEALAGAGHAVTVVTLAADGRDTIEHHGPNVVVHRINPLISVKSGHFSWRYIRLVRDLCRDADIVHLHEPNPVATLSVLVSKIPGRLIVSWHGDIVRQRFVLPFLKPLHAHTLRRASAICVQTAALIDHSYALPGFRNKCKVLPTGIDLDPFTAANLDLAAQEELRMQAGSRYVLATGRMASYKGFDVLLRALAGTKIHAVIAGEGPERTSLMQLRDQLGLTRQVWFPGSVSENRLQALYAACDVFVLPSINNSETFGLVQLEAMACGKPVINTSLPTGVPEVSLHNLTGLTVPPGDSEALGAAIALLMQDASLRERLGRAARKRVETTYSSQAVIVALEKIYLDCLSGSQPHKSVRNW